MRNERGKVKDERGRRKKEGKQDKEWSEGIGKRGKRNGIERRREK